MGVYKSKVCECDTFNESFFCTCSSFRKLKFQGFVRGDILGVRKYKVGGSYKVDSAHLPLGRVKGSLGVDVVRKTGGGSCED